MTPKYEPQFTSSQQETNTESNKMTGESSIEQQHRKEGQGEDGKDEKSWWTWMEKNIGSEELGMLSPQILCNRSSVNNVAEKKEDRFPGFDFAAMHAMLIESLLDEQQPTENQGDPQLSPNSSYVDSDADLFLSDSEPVPNNRDPVLQVKSDVSNSSTSSFFKRPKKNKRKRLRSKKETAPILLSLPPENDVGNKTNFSSIESSVSISSNSTFLPSPGSFLAPHCRLQKDKGNGFEPGTAITCFGKEASLEKLRTKTAILGQSVARDDKNSTGNDNDTDTSFKRPWGVLKPTARAEMRRGAVKLTKLNPPETRSILEVKMGFLSLKYGILLQWSKTEGLVELVVMRKMVTGAFMDVEAVDFSKLRRRSIEKRIPNTKRNPSHTNKHGYPPIAPLPDIPPTPSDYDGDDSIETLSQTRSQDPDTDVDQIDFSRISVAADEELPADNHSEDEEKPKEVDTIEHPKTPKINNKQHDKPIPDPPSTPKETTYTIRNIIHGSKGSNAIVERTNSYESVNDASIEQLLPPYLVSRPKRFSPSSITVTVLRARGLMRKRKQVSAYVRLSTKNESHRTGVIKMSKNPVWRDKDDNHCTLSVDDDLDDVLKVEICDKRHLLKDRVLSVLYVPFELVEPHSVGGLPPTEITIPCRMLDKTGPYGSITLALAYESPYHWWMREEVRARAKAKKDANSGEIEVKADEEDDSLWTSYWFCCY